MRVPEEPLLSSLATTPFLSTLHPTDDDGDFESGARAENVRRVGASKADAAPAAAPAPAAEAAEPAKAVDSTGAALAVGDKVEAKFKGCVSPSAVRFS